MNIDKNKACSVCYRNFFNFCAAIKCDFTSSIFNMYDWGSFRFSDVGVVLVIDRDTELLLEFYENTTRLRSGGELIYKSDSLSHTVQIEVARILEDMGYVKVIEQYRRLEA